VGFSAISGAGCVSAFSARGECRAELADGGLARRFHFIRQKTCWPPASISIGFTLGGLFAVLCSLPPAGGDAFCGVGTIRTVYFPAADISLAVVTGGTGSVLYFALTGSTPSTKPLPAGPSGVVVRVGDGRYRVFHDFARIIPDNKKWL
jgi:hypothetical protein